MNRPEKWESGVSASSKLRAVARRAIAARLERVTKNLTRATKDSRGQADDIHRLRTWSRRSAAAIELFRPLLPRKERKWFAGKLKKVRQAAGSVRDLDVMLEKAADNASLTEELKKQRGKALKPLAKLHKRLLRRDELGSRQWRLLENIEQPKLRLGEWGTRRLKEQAAALAVLGEGRLSAQAAAHEFRIAGKELRYVLEIMGHALPLAAVKVYAVLGDLQQRIGVICDHAAAEMMYRQLLAKVSPSHRQPLRTAIAAAMKGRAKTHQAFLRWWTPRRKAAFREALDKAGLL